MECVAGGEGCSPLCNLTTLCTHSLGAGWKILHFSHTTCITTTFLSELYHYREMQRVHSVDNCVFDCVFLCLKLGVSPQPVVHQGEAGDVVSRTWGGSAHLQTHAADLEVLLQPHQPQVQYSSTHYTGNMFCPLDWTELCMKIAVKYVGHTTIATCGITNHLQEYYAV